MAHFNWTYVSDHQTQHQVGIIHGEKDGHVLIYVEGKVMTIDFNVRQSKTYTFFIDHELCRIELDQRGAKGTFYEFHIDRKTDTPLNQARRKRERKHLRQTLLMIGGVAAVILLAVGGIALSAPEDPYEVMAQQLAEGSQKTIGVVQVQVSETSGRPSISYQFEAQGRAVQVDLNYERSFEVLRGQVLPIRTGDELFVQYSPEDPLVNLIDFDAPSREQLETYRRRVINKHLELHEELTRELAACEVDAAYEVKGKSGYADLLFQQTEPVDNPINNRLTYQRLTRETAYDRLIKEKCW